MTWNNPKATKLEGERAKNVESALQEMLPAILRKAMKEMLELKKNHQDNPDKEVKPTRDVIIAKMTQDFVHEMFQRMLEFATVVDAYVLGMSTDNMISKSPETITMRTLHVDARAYLRGKVGRDQTRHLRDQRVMEVMALFTGYLFTTTTVVFSEDFDTDAERDDATISVFYLFMETVISCLKTLALTTDVADTITDHLEGKGSKVKHWRTDFIERIHGEGTDRFQAALLAKSQYFNKQFNEARDARNDSDSSTSEDEAPPSGETQH